MSLILKKKIFKKLKVIRNMKTKVTKKVKFNLKITNIKFSIKKKIKNTSKIKYETIHKLLTYQLNSHQAISQFKKNQHSGSNKTLKSTQIRKNTGTKIPKRSQCLKKFCEK